MAGDYTVIGTGEYDESRDGNFIIEIYPPGHGRIVLAERRQDGWRLAYYDGSPADFRRDKQRIIAVAEAKRQAVGWTDQETRS